MQTQPKSAVRSTRTVRTSARREKHGNVIEWRIRRLALPTATGEGNTPEIIPASRQNIWLGVFVILVFLFAAGAMAGAL